MSKPFEEALSDGFKHIISISDPERIRNLRGEGILIDSNGYYSFSFGDKKEYEFALEPISSEGIFRIVLYKNGVVLTEPLIMRDIDNI